MVILFRMTNTAVTISVKIPPRVLEQIPAAGNGRSGFILQALEEKLARQNRTQWKSVTRRGRKLSAVLRKGLAERQPLLSREQINRELAARRGRGFENLH